jgi:hypothetical protein
MICDTTRSPNPAGHAGLLENLFALASALTGFFEDRFALFARESKAAFVQLLVLAACLILGLVFCVLGYVFLIASAVVGCFKSLSFIRRANDHCARSFISKRGTDSIPQLRNHGSSGLRRLRLMANGYRFC